MTRALVVEDNADLATNVAELLETLDLDVVIASDGEKAVENAKRTEFDLAIVDVRLPGGRSGVDLLPLLRAHSPNSEIILVTGNATVDSAVAAVRHGAFAYVQKPFDSRDFIAIADRALAQVRLRREKEALAEELALSEELYRNVVETVDALIVTLDASLRVVFCNRTACVTAGFEASEVQGKPFLETFVDDTLREKLAVQLRSVLYGSTIRGVELGLMNRPTGELRTVRWTFKSLTTRPGESAVLAAGVDVTERLVLERRSAESQALAAVGALTTGLAHEIRNPLNAASLQLEALVRGARRIGDVELKERIETRVGIVRAELGRLSSMLNDFLSLARPHGIQAKAFDLGALVDEVVELKRPLAEEQGVTVTTELGPEARTAKGDVPKVKQVLLNLLANALEALRERGRGTITVRTRTKGPGIVEVSVLDDGPGFGEKSEHDLFQPFVTTKEAGTGLGLAIVKKIVLLHGGTVHLESRPEGGAAAVFTLQAG